MLECHVVEDHCDALQKIHGHMRRKLLPETISMLHFDAHPDLMVTADMPAQVCFRPQELYRALEESEGGIAEWILPLVYEGHLTRLVWVRSPWSDQFKDGRSVIPVGRVKTADDESDCVCDGNPKKTRRKDEGLCRVASEAPYFVDDQLFCPETDMDNVKRVEVLVCPCCDLLPQGGQVVPGGTEWGEKVSIGAPTKAEEGEGEGFRQRQGRGGGCEDGVVGGRGPTSMEGADFAGAARGLLLGDGGGAAWVLDICLDYFVTANPFREELLNMFRRVFITTGAAAAGGEGGGEGGGEEEEEGEEDEGGLPKYPPHAAVREARSLVAVNTVFNVYARPKFRGAHTCLPHAQQIKDEAAFRTLVAALVRAVGVDQALGSEGTTGEPPPQQQQQQQHGREEGEEGEEVCRISTELAELYPDGEGVALLTRFRAVLRLLSEEQRALLLDFEYCVCLPHHISTDEQVSAMITEMEHLLEGLLLRMAPDTSPTATLPSVALDGSNTSSSTSSSSTSSTTVGGGRPGLITIALSQGDGFTPPERVAAIFSQVRATLERVYGPVKVIVDEECTLPLPLPLPPHAPS